MPIADRKKFQTCVNLLHLRVTKPVAEAADVASKIRDAMVANDLHLRLTPTERAVLNDFITSLDTLATSPVIAKMEGIYHATHRNRALTIEGVNG